MRRYVLIGALPVFIMVCFLSCQQKNVPDVAAIVADFSKLECRAVHIREQRYALANTIRFTEDSMALVKDINDKKKALQDSLNSYLKTKDDLLALSLRLADTIKLKLDTIIKVQLKTKDNIAEFDKQLSAALIKQNCN